MTSSAYYDLNGVVKEQYEWKVVDVGGVEDIYGEWRIWMEWQIWIRVGLRDMDESRRYRTCFEMAGGVGTKKWIGLRM